MTNTDIQVQSGLVQLSTSGYTFTRPVMLDADNIELVGGHITAQCTPAFAIGIKAVSADHYPVNSVTGKTAYRTLGNARLSLPAEAWDVGSQALTIEFVVEPTTPASGQVGLFGFIRNQKPSPWYCAVVDGKFQLRFALADGSVKSFMVPWPSGRVVGTVSVEATTGSCSIALNGTVSRFVFGIASLAPRGTPYFGVGAIADRAYGWGDYVGGAHDWTYQALKVTGGASSGPQANEASTPFCRLLCDGPGPVHCYNGQHVFGFMLDVAQGNTNHCRIHDVTISSSLSYGPLIAVGGCYSPTFERLTLSGGGQSIASLGGLWSYPVRLVDCELGAAYYGWGQSLWGERNNFQYCGAEFHQSFVSLRDTFVAGSPKGGTMFKIRDGSIFVADVGQADYEGLPPTGYFDYDPSCSVKVTNWVKGKNTPIAV